MNSETKICRNCKNSFTVEPEDFLFYEKINVPPPTFCPDCRNQRRWSFRNERSLYKRTCGLCNKPIVSMYAPDKPSIVYCVKCWYSDKWDPLTYGREYDFSKPFFEQLRSLIMSVPRIALVQENMVNSEWCNYERGAKNSYLCVGGEDNEHCSYLTYGIGSKEVLDSFWIIKSELSANLINCGNCYKTFFSHWCFDCQDTWFSYDCKNCRSTFGSVGLRNKEYCVFNRQYSKEEYQKIIQNYFPLTSAKMKAVGEKVESLRRTLPQKDFVAKSTRSSGNYIAESKNCADCWNVDLAEDSKFNFVVAFGKDSYDVSSIGWLERVYECYSGVHLYDCKFSSTTLTGSFAEYCESTNQVQNVFGCVGLRNKSYCILNKEYPKQEYEKLVMTIKNHMNTMPYVDKGNRIYKYGEFFPIELSPFDYNESTAQQYYPLTKQEALSRGYRWRDQETKNYTITKKAEELPDNVQDANDSILNETIGCAHKGECNQQCTVAFRIVADELNFYRKTNLPFPRLCPNCRHHERLKQRNPLKLWHRTCVCAGASSQNAVYKNSANHFHGADRCPNEFESSYALERPEIIYCEQCYNAEVV